MNIRWGRRAYTKEQFIFAWNSSTSIAEVSKKLNTNRSGSGFYALRDAAESLGLTQDHMPTTRTSRSGKTQRISIEDILSNKVSYSNTNRLKSRLYAAGLLTKQCSTCGIIEWQGQPAPLALDHINGNRKDNSLINLRILCYNCHGQTSTFGSKNTAKRL